MAGGGFPVRATPPQRRLLDLGAGTGSWSAAFRRWYPGLDILAVEPSAAMRARCPHRPLIAGDATAIPLRAATADIVWLSTVIHHLPYLAATARELRRVLRPGGRVLIRSAFAGRGDAITLFRFFPEAVRVLDSYPSIPSVQAAFASAGFTPLAVEPAPSRPHRPCRPRPTTCSAPPTPRSS